jgi:hypothetical protein
VVLTATLLAGLRGSERLRAPWPLVIGGEVGSNKSVKFGASKKLVGQTVALRVDELLPLP